MRYIKPSIKIEEVQTDQILAVSFIVSDKIVDAGDALVKEDDSWIDWDDEED